MEGYFPATDPISRDLPERARTLLSQARDSLHTPSGAVLLSASAVDAMLKAKGYTDGSLYSRIDQASKAHVITLEMAQWAHQVRLDANGQRHSDEEEPLPTREEAQRCVDFAIALGEFMFALPARVTRGLNPPA